MLNISRENKLQNVLISCGNMDFCIVPSILFKKSGNPLSLYTPYFPLFSKISRYKKIGSIRDFFHTKLLRMYDHIIYISKSQESEIVSRIGDNRNFLLYENLIPERDYMPKWKKVKQDVFRIAVPGRLVNRQKNQIMALDILNKLLELGYKIEMLFIGGGKDFKMLIYHFV